MKRAIFSKKISTAFGFAVILLLSFPVFLHTTPIKQSDFKVLGRMKAERDFGGILTDAMKDGKYPRTEIAKGILIKSEYSGFWEFYSAGLGVLFSSRQLIGFFISFVIFWLLFLALRFLAWHKEYDEFAALVSGSFTHSEERFLNLVCSKFGVLMISGIVVFLVQYCYFIPYSIHLNGYEQLKPIGFSGIWIGMIPLYIFMILPRMAPSAIFCGGIALLAAGSVHFMGVYSFTSAYAGMVFAGLTPFFLFSLLFSATFLFAPISPRSKWRKAKTDAHRYLCGHCYGRFELGPGLPRFVRTFGRLFAREVPLKHKDFRDYFVCRKCGCRDKKFEDVRFVTAVIDTPRAYAHQAVNDASRARAHQETEYEHGGVHLLINVTAHEKKIIEVDADALEIRNAPGLDYDFLIQDFYLGLTADPLLKSKLETGRFPVILVNDPPLSTNARRLIEEWFENIRTRQK